MEQKWTELKEETDDSTIIVGDFKPSSAIDIIDKKKINKGDFMNNTVNHIDLTGISRTPY